ncbi:MAG: hypothetical protein ACOC3Z_01300 [Nanoarchaeota archaeon]
MNKGVFYLGLFLIASFVILGFDSFVSSNVPSLTGNVISEPYQNINCGDVELKKIWSSVFYESSSGIVIQNNSACTEILMSKTSGNSGWIIYLYDIEGTYIMISRYGEGNQTFIDDLNSVTFSNWQNYGEKEYVEDHILINEIDNISETEDFFESVFIVDSENWFETSDGFKYNESKKEGDFLKTAEGIVYENKSFSVYDFRNKNTEDYTIIQKNNIEDFEIYENSKWDEEFDADNYFSGIVDTYSCISEGNNLDLSEINCSIDSEGWVSFRPKKDFKGKFRFKIRAKNTYVEFDSDWFNVSVVVDVNDAPKIVEDIPNLFILVNESYKLNLEGYFEDDDGDDLDYQVKGLDKNISVKVSGDEIIFIPEKDYEGWQEFRIIANDSELSGESNEIKINVGKLLDVNIFNNESNTNVTLSENKKPVIEKYINYSSYNFSVGDEVKLYVNASDEDEESLNYTWFVNGEKVENFTTNEAIFRDLKVGKNEIKVEVTDGFDTAEHVWTVYSELPSFNWGLLGLIAIIFIIILFMLGIVALVLWLFKKTNIKEKREKQLQESNNAVGNYLNDINNEKESENIENQENNSEKEANDSDEKDNLNEKEVNDSDSEEKIEKIEINNEKNQENTDDAVKRYLESLNLPKKTNKSEEKMGKDEISFGKKEEINKKIGMINKNIKNKEEISDKEKLRKLIQEKDKINTDNQINERKKEQNIERNENSLEKSGENEEKNIKKDGNLEIRRFKFGDN